MKNKSQIQVNGNVIEIHTKNAPFLANTFIGFLAFSMFLLPIFTVIMMISTGEELRFGVFIGFGFFWFLSYWMTRQFLWNVYGKEVISFTKRKISYHADFKYFQDSHQELEADNFDVYVLDVKEWDVELGKIVFANSDGEIEIATKIPLGKATILVEKFMGRG